MTNDELRELELRLKQYLDQRDFDELNTLVQSSADSVRDLSPDPNDAAYNQQIKSFIETYLAVRHCLQEQYKELQKELGKLNKAKKGIKQYHDV